MCSVSVTDDASGINVRAVGEQIKHTTQSPFTLFTLNCPNNKIITWSLLHLQNNIISMTVLSIVVFFALTTF